MNENSSKQVLLSVLGIAVLVVAVVGVSFAFFTYSRAGSNNNTLTTGSIFFNFVEGNTLILTNQFPVSDTVGSSTAVTANGHDVLTFSVTGYNTSSKAINYTITALQGTPENNKTRFRDDEIKLLLTGTDKAAAPATTNNFATAKVVSNSADDLASGVVLANGSIPAGTPVATPATHNYEVRMWISDTVQLDDSGANVSATDDHKYTSSDFTNMYYSLKVKVEAATATGA